MEIDFLEEGFFYHIYNRGNNASNIFFDEGNYEYFLKLLDKYIIPVAEIYAFCLMKNHFHLLVRIKESEKIDITKLKYSTVEKPKIVNASKQFSHFLNAYSQAVNKKYDRTGSLFEKPFHRKRILDDDYLRRVILYIHNNPKNHFNEDISTYKWNSYKTFLSKSPTKISKEFVLSLFENLDNFVLMHKNFDGSSEDIL